MTTLVPSGGKKRDDQGPNEWESCEVLGKNVVEWTMTS